MQVSTRLENVEISSHSGSRGPKVENHDIYGVY
jgi:hypothetical protein